jgi:hypothetical protein
MPFANYDTFDACVTDQISKGYTKDQAGGVCATIHKKATGKYPTEYLEIIKEKIAKIKEMLK